MRINPKNNGIANVIIIDESMLEFIKL